jgi:hypothetical protein
MWLALGVFADQDAVGRRNRAGTDAEQGLEGGVPCLLRALPPLHTRAFARRHSPFGGDRTSAYSGKSGAVGGVAENWQTASENCANFAGRPRRALSHLPCTPLFQRVCVTPRTSPVTPPWRPSRRRDRAVPVMALFSFVALASALVLAFSFG